MKKVDVGFNETAVIVSNDEVQVHSSAREELAGLCLFVSENNELVIADIDEVENKPWTYVGTWEGDIDNISTDQNYSEPKEEGDNSEEGDDTGDNGDMMDLFSHGDEKDLD